MDKVIKIPALAAIPMLLAHEAAYLTSYETLTIQVEDKNSVFDDRNADPRDGYTPINWLVHTPGETFKVGVDWRRGEFAMAERYHALKPGGTYRVEVAGWRVPALNWYRNIVRIEQAGL